MDVAIGLLGWMLGYAISYVVTGAAEAASVREKARRLETKRRRLKAELFVRVATHQ